MWEVQVGASAYLPADSIHFYRVGAEPTAAWSRDKLY